MLDKQNKRISIKRQCELLSISRTQYYYHPKQESVANLELMCRIDKEYLKHPYYGVKRMTAQMRQETGGLINEKRVRRLMRKMGIETIYRKPNLSRRDKQHKVYPYLLRNVKIERANQVWSTDITYIPMKHGFMYLTAVIDWHSRYILSWGLSNSLSTESSIEALEMALKQGKPKIFNTDQGSQYTSTDFIGILERENIEISMDGRGRALDNIFIERFWRTIKYECIYLNEFKDGRELYDVIKNYINFYNNERLHQSLGYRTPSDIYKCRIDSSLGNVG